MEIAQERKARQVAEQGAAVATEKAGGLVERLHEAKARIAALEKVEDKLALLTDSYHKQQGELLAANMAVARAEAGLAAVGG